MKNIFDHVVSNSKKIMEYARNIGDVIDFRTNESINEEIEKHSYSNTQLRIPREITEKVLEFGLSIPDEKVYTDPEDPAYGRELNPHITIKYGLVTENPDDIENLVEDDVYAFPVKLGKVSLFSKDDKPYDVVKVGVESEELHRLHNLFSKLENKDGNPEYVPHMTVAYVKKGMGDDYVGRDDFDGMEFVADSFDFKDQSGNGKQIVLNLKEDKNNQEE
jgi:2'-5' RNA ligase